jgi:DMSO/TMAO reductase YedYZ heme-binding membrane subunit
LSALTLTAIAVHLGALVADNYVHFGAKELLIPYASTWKPGAVALGIVATYLLVLIEVTSLLMKHLPKKLWRAVHTSSYAVAWLSVVHGALAGTDATTRVYQVGALILIIIAVTATSIRITVGRHAEARKTAAAAAPRGDARAAARAERTPVQAESIPASPESTPVSDRTLVSWPPPAPLE